MVKQLKCKRWPFSMRKLFSIRLVCREKYQCIERRDAIALADICQLLLDASLL
jgi:hypothetical protein